MLNQSFELIGDWTIPNHEGVYKGKLSYSPLFIF